MASADIPGMASPNDGDYFVRELESIKQQMRELGPSVAKSVQIVVRQQTLPVTVWDEFTGDPGDPTYAPSGAFTPGTYIIRRPVTVPAGYNSLYVVGTGVVLAELASGSVSYPFRIGVRVGTGLDTALARANEDPTQSSVPVALSLTGLTPGSTINIQIEAAEGGTNDVIIEHASIGLMLVYHKS